MNGNYKKKLTQDHGYGDSFSLLFILGAFVLFIGAILFLIVAEGNQHLSNLESEANKEITKYYDGETIEKIIENEKETGWTHKVIFLDGSVGYVNAKCDGEYVSSVSMVMSSLSGKEVKESSYECEVDEVDFKSKS